MKENQSIQNQFLNISVFYAEQQWSVLLKKGLLPFLKQTGKKYAYKYILYFGKDRGDHVGFTVQIDKGASIFLKEFDDYIKVFLSNDPSEWITQEDNSGKLFMDFPNNTVQYAVHQFFPLPLGDIRKDSMNLWHSLSEILLKNLSKCSFSMEDLFALCMRLRLLLLLSYQTEPMKRESPSNQISENKPDNFEELYNENKKILQHIRQECWTIKNGTIKNELTWMNDFIEVITEFVDCCNENDGLGRLNYIKVGLNRQFGINEEANALLNYFIQKLLNSNSYEKAGLFNSHSSSH